MAPRDIKGRRKDNDHDNALRSFVAPPAISMPPSAYSKAGRERERPKEVVSGKEDAFGRI